MFAAFATRARIVAWMKVDPASAHSIAEQTLTRWRFMAPDWVRAARFTARSLGACVREYYFRFHAGQIPLMAKNAKPNSISAQVSGSGTLGAWYGMVNTCN